MDNKAKRRNIVYNPYLGSRIEYFRLKKGLTKDGLRIACGYSSTGIIPQIINGTSGMSNDKFHKLCKELEVDPNILAYPSSLTNEELEIAHNFFRLLKNRKKSKHFPSIISLIEQDLTNIAKNVKK